MNLYFFTEVRLDRVDGVIWCPQAFSMALWQRYLEKFEHVFVICRVNHTNNHSNENLVKLDDDRVSVIDLPYYIGIFSYLKLKKVLKAEINSFIHLGDAYICRVPGLIGTLAVECLVKKNIPYGIEVVGNPWESLAQISNPVLSFVLKRIGKSQLMYIAKHSSAALYVTNYILQKEYPVKEGVFTTGASNVILNDNYYSKEPYHVDLHLSNRQIKILSVGSLAQMYKAPDIILKALAKIKEKGYNPYLTWFGDGKFKDDMIKLANDLGLEQNVNFAGTVKQDVIRQEFLNTDIFIHASRAEGLPRAVVEAMAYGLPCIGSSIAGIPELLDKKAIISPGSVAELAEKIHYFIKNPDFMQNEAIKNWHESKKYHNDILSKRRLDFYEELIEKSKI